MKPRKPNTEVNFNNCSFEYGIEFAITGNNSEAVEITKKLKSMAEGQDFEGSADQFMTDYAIGYKDTGVSGYNREMPRLPSICSSCQSKANCYTTTDTGFRKKEP